MAIKFTTQPVARNATSRNLDSISAAECKLQDKIVEYVENSQYEILPDKGYDGIAKVNVTVNVPTSGEYSYKKNLADVNGLKAIGWDDESIGVYGDNVLGYEWQRSDYLVSQANKDLAEGFTKDTISSNQSNPDFVYCPMFDTSSITDMNFMFSNCSNLKSIPLLDTGSATSMNYMFQNCSNLQSIPQLDTSSVTSMNNMFDGCSKLQSIPLLDAGSITGTTTPFGFGNFSKLTDLGGFKDLKVSWSSNFLDKVPNATVESLMNVINNLYDLTANGLSGQKVKFGTKNLNKLTDEQKAVATNKGWTLL